MIILLTLSGHLWLNPSAAMGDLSDATADAERNPYLHLQDSLPVDQ